MKRILPFILLAFMLVSCGEWGGYKHKSEAFKFNFVFPPNWDVMDRSDENRDLLTAELPEVPGSKIVVSSRGVAADVSPNEIYPYFMQGGGSASTLNQFRILDRGTISGKNVEGRFIRFQYLGEPGEVECMRAIFLGNRFIVEINAEVPKEVFVDQEPNFRKMFSFFEI